MKFLMKKSLSLRIAFTLAETLITLGIIGVVAALTIPALNARIRGKRLQSQFMKTYSELNQASRAFYADTDSSVQDYYDTLSSSSSKSTIALGKFLTYFKGVNVNTQTVSNSNSYQPELFDKKYNIKNYNLSNLETNYYPCDASSIITDINGRLFSMDGNFGRANIDTGPKICVDINGVDKPNKWGVDRFVFVFTNTNSVVPYTGISWSDLDVQQSDENEAAKYCNSQILVPHTCAYFALKDKSPDGKGNYWYDFLKGK